MTVEKPKPKQLLRSITTGTNSSMNQSQFLAITCNSLEAREKSRVRGAIGFGFASASHWLKNWRESLKPITKRSNSNHIITFYSHLKTALIGCFYSRDHWACFSTKTKESVWIRKEFNPRRICWGHQHGRREEGTFFLNVILPIAYRKCYRAIGPNKMAPLASILWEREQ